MRTFFKARLNNSSGDHLCDATLFSILEKDPGNIILIAKTGRNAGDLASGEKVHVSRFTLHYGSKSRDFSSVHYHYRDGENRETDFVALTNAVKGSTFFPFLHMLCPYSIPTFVSHQSHFPENHIGDFPISAGQIIYSVAIGNPEVNFNSKLLVPELGIGHFETIIRKFKIIVLYVSTDLPTTRLGKTLSVETSRPDLLSEAGSRIMKNNMKGLDYKEFIASFILHSEFLAYDLCKRIIEHPERDNCLVFNQYSKVTQFFFDRSKISYDTIVRHNGLHLINNKIIHPLDL